MRPAKLALIWLVVVTTAEAQGPEPSRAVAHARDDGTETGGEALARWRRGVEVSPVLGDSECHTIHTYFNTSPESPDGRLFVTDARLESPEGPRRFWGVVVGDLASGEHELVYRFDNSKGATSWRRSHPHPVFSPDGRRIYFNVSSHKWTRLYVAESSLQRLERPRPAKRVSWREKRAGHLKGAPSGLCRRRRLWYNQSLFRGLDLSVSSRRAASTSVSTSMKSQGCTSPYFPEATLTPFSS